MPVRCSPNWMSVPSRRPCSDSVGLSACAWLHGPRMPGASGHGQNAFQDRLRRAHRERGSAGGRINLPGHSRLGTRFTWPLADEWTSPSRPFHQSTPTRPRSHGVARKTRKSFPSSSVVYNVRTGRINAVTPVRPSQRWFILRGVPGWGAWQLRRVHVKARLETRERSVVPAASRSFRVGDCGWPGCGAFCRG